MSEMSCYHIDAFKKTVTRTTYTGLADLQKMVGGLICLAHAWPNGDVLFVNDEGLYKFPDNHFFMEGGVQPFAGNGVIVGKEYRNSSLTRPPKNKLEDVTRGVTFMHRGDVIAWSHRNPHV